MTSDHKGESVKEGILEIVGLLQKMNQKLDYLIKKQTEDFFGQSSRGPKYRYEK